MSLVSTSLKGLGLVALVAAGLTIWAMPGTEQKAAPVSIPVVPVSKAVSASPDGIPLASPRAAAVMRPSAANAWGGPRTGKEPTLSDRVVNYDIQATLDPVKHIVDGREKLTWRNRSNREVRAVYLHMYLNAFEGSYSTFFSEKRNNGFGFRTEVGIDDGQWGHIQLGGVAQSGLPVSWLYVHPDGGPDTDHTVVRLDLPTAVPPGGSTTLDIDFQDQLPRVVARTGYFGTFHLVGQWFPKIAVLELPGERGMTEPTWNAHEFHLHSEFYADYGNYDVKLTVPKDYTVGATGEEQGDAVENGDKVTHHFVQGDVHDFAWTADNRTAKPLEGTYTGEGSPTVKVRVLYPPEYLDSAAPALKATIDSLGYFSKTLGAYPYKTVTVVIPPYNATEAGGMEYPTFFTSEGYSDIKPDTLKSFFLDFVTIHEFGHGYFYGILGSNEFEEPMLDEGLNDYWDFRMVRERGQDIHMTSGFLKKLGIDPVMQAFEEERRAASNLHPADATGANSWDRLSTASYVTVYARTATTMHDLEEQLGKPVMEKAFKQYYETWKYRHPSIADLQATISDVSGKPQIVAAAFAQQVYSTHMVDDRVETLISEEEVPQVGSTLVNGKWIEVTKEQAEKLEDDQRQEWEKKHPDAKEGTGPFPYRTIVTLRREGAADPQTLVVKFVDGSSETAVWNDNQRWARFSWVKPVKAVSAEIDPQHIHYLDADK
ncbi:MAG TPA: M1 family metallopeptidase, partial [Burkholderiaceae bacterium]|nr:M1 family metallopeptidase [Burkholderiaceae bacterium]